MQDVYVFPAVFTIEKDGVDAEFPDLGLVTEGDNLEQALYMAQDALSGRLYLDEVHKDTIPEPSDPLAIPHENNQLVVPVRVDMAKYRLHNSRQAVNKMVTLPQWLISEAKDAGINFSHTLRDALIEKLKG